MASVWLAAHPPASQSETMLTNMDFNMYFMYAMLNFMLIYKDFQTWLLFNIYFLCHVKLYVDLQRFSNMAFFWPIKSHVSQHGLSIWILSMQI